MGVGKKIARALKKLFRRSRPIYLGKNSVYAALEGIYVKQLRNKGTDTLAEAAGIAKLLLRDLRRGYTYDHHGRKIKMTTELFEKRLKFLIFLAKKFGGPVSKVRELVKYVEKHKRLPKWAEALAKKAIARR